MTQSKDSLFGIIFPFVDTYMHIKIYTYLYQGYEKVRDDYSMHVRDRHITYLQDLVVYNIAGICVTNGVSDPWYGLDGIY